MVEAMTIETQPIRCSSGKTKPGSLHAFFKASLSYAGEECLIWPYSTTVGGYPQIQINRHRWSVTRLVCENEWGKPIDQKMEAAHSCGNKRCVNRAHLRWATKPENEADKKLHGTVMCGRRHHGAKLSEDQVREVLSLRGSFTTRMLAEMFGMSQSQISRIHLGQSWSYALTEDS